MTSRLFATILITSSALALTACPGGSDDTGADSLTGGLTSTSGETTGTASASTTSGSTTTPTTGESATDGTTTDATTDADTTTGGTTEPATSGTTTSDTTTATTTTESTTSETTDGTSDSGTSEMTSGTTGGGGELEDSCSLACDLVIECDPDLYRTKDECVEECLAGASPVPACQAAAAAFNNCIAGYTCEQYAAANENDFGECADEFDAYITACE